MTDRMERMAVPDRMERMGVPELGNGAEARRFSRRVSAFEDDGELIESPAMQEMKLILRESYAELEKKLLQDVGSKLMAQMEPVLENSVRQQQLHAQQMKAFQESNIASCRKMEEVCKESIKQISLESRQLMVEVGESLQGQIDEQKQINQSLNALVRRQHQELIFADRALQSALEEQKATHQAQVEEQKKWMEANVTTIREQISQMQQQIKGLIGGMQAGAMQHGKELHSLEQQLASVAGNTESMAEKLQQQIDLQQKQILERDQELKLQQDEYTSQIKATEEDRKAIETRLSEFIKTATKKVAEQVKKLEQLQTDQMIQVNTELGKHQKRLQRQQVQMVALQNKQKTYDHNLSEQDKKWHAELSEKIGIGSSFMLRTLDPAAVQAHQRMWRGEKMVIDRLLLPQSLSGSSNDGNPVPLPHSSSSSSTFPSSSSFSLSQSSPKHEETENLPRESNGADAEVMVRLPPWRR